MKEFSRQYLQSDPKLILDENYKIRKKITNADLWEPCQSYWEENTFRLLVQIEN